MKKILFLIVLLIFGTFIWVKFFAGSQAANYVSQHLSEKLQVPVTIDNIIFHIRSFLIKNLLIKNPQRAKLPNALQAKEILFEAPYFNYLKSQILIDKIQINDLYVSIEFYDKQRSKGNWTTLMENLNVEESDQIKQKKEKKGKTALIKLLEINNVKIDLILPGQAPISLDPIKQITFHDLNTEKGLPMEEITEIITKELMKQISILKGFQNMLEGLFDLPKGAVESIFSPFKKFSSSNSDSLPTGN